MKMKLLQGALVILLMACQGTNSMVQAMQDYEQMDSHPHVQRAGYTEVQDKPDTPWYSRTVSIRTLLVTCAVSVAITLGCTLGPLRAQVGDLEQENAYLSCCANMNYRAVEQLCPINTSGRVAGNCTPSSQTRRVLWCHPNVLPRNNTFNKCSRLKWH